MGWLSFSFPFLLFGIWGNGGSGVVLFCANVFFIVIAIDFLTFVLQFFDFIRISCVENSPVCLSLLSFFCVFSCAFEVRVGLGWDRSIPKIFYYREFRACAYAMMM